MQIEIERKFLVNESKWNPDRPGIHYTQGYIAVTPLMVVRVRIKGDEACLTLKSATTNLSRREYEYMISVSDAQELLKDSTPHPPIEKIRYKIPYGGHMWDVDEFRGANQGLLLAEIELETEDEIFEHPPWIGKEVTGDKRFYNACLYQHPFQLSWLDQ